MLLYFLSVIAVRARMLEQNGALKDGKKDALLHEINERRRQLENCVPGSIGEDAAWTEAYQLERMMALLEPEENLIAELGLRLDEAAAERVPAEPRLRAAFTALSARALDPDATMLRIRAEAEPEARALLLEVLEELHWTVQRKFYGRPIQKAATRQIVYAGVISFGLFVLPYLFIYIAAPFRQLNFGFLTGLPLYTALTAGLFGAFFSRLLFIQANAAQLTLGELKTAREWTSIFLRGSVGMCGGLVVFFFLRSGIVDGSLFPNFGQFAVLEQFVPMREARQGEQVADVRQLRLLLPSPSLALLAVWCFLAGFSERLVPSILSSTEETLSQAGGQKK